MGTDPAREARQAYGLLGLKPHCGDDELTAAYRQLALKWHPDRHLGKDAEAAQQQFQQISAAHDLLVKHRKTYGVPASGAGGGGGTAGGATGQRTANSSGGGGGGGGYHGGAASDRYRSEFGYGGDPRAGEPNTWRSQHNEFGYKQGGGAGRRSDFRFTAEHGRGFTNPTHFQAEAPPLEMKYSRTELRIRTASVAGVFFVGCYMFLTAFVRPNDRSRRINSSAFRSTPMAAVPLKAGPPAQPAVPKPTAQGAPCVVSATVPPDHIQLRLRGSLPRPWLLRHG
jgi:curved DNA-binding protein CbpA